MPWHKVHSDGKWKVVKDADGKVVGTHDSEDDANKQLAALYASEKRAVHLGDKYERKERGGYASGDLTARELPPPPPSVTVQRVHRDDDRRSR